MTDRSKALFLSVLLVASLCMAINSDGGTIVHLKPPPHVTQPVLPKGPAAKGSPVGTNHPPLSVAIQSFDKAGVPLSKPGVSIAPSSATHSATGSVYFKVGKSSLDPGTLNALKQFTDQLKSNPHANVTVAGYADRTGTPLGNAALSSQRTREVAAALESLGIPKERIQTYWAGDTHASAEQADASHAQALDPRAIDRRVDVLLSIPGEESPAHAVRHHPSEP